MQAQEAVLATLPEHVVCGSRHATVGVRGDLDADMRHSGSDQIRRGGQAPCLGDRTVPTIVKGTSAV
jgi:hypothetical protein